jgi:hypothetical protein
MSPPVCSNEFDISTTVELIYHEAITLVLQENGKNESRAIPYTPTLRKRLRYSLQLLLRSRKYMYLDCRRMSIRPAVASSLRWCDNVALEMGSFALKSLHEISSLTAAIRSRISNLRPSTRALVIRRNVLLSTEQSYLRSSGRSACPERVARYAALDRYAL